jgi:hypothetical protein
MKYVLLISCLILFSCSSEEEPTLSSSSGIASSSSSTLPSSSSAEIEPSILGCPPEDVTELPILGEITFEDMERMINEAGAAGDIYLPLAPCFEDFEITKKGLSFDVQGGVRCIATFTKFGIDKGYFGITKDEDCIKEGEYFSYNKIKCSWLTATKVGDRVVHISVNQNETGNERKLKLLYMGPSCINAIVVTQSAE